MRSTIFAIRLILLVLSSVGLGIAQDSSNTKNSTFDERIVIAYSVKDLAVWTEDNKFDPSILTALIEAKFNGEGFRIAVQVFYPNQSLLITAGTEEHDQIAKTLEKFKKK